MKALDGLDQAFEHRARLAIAVLLARHGEISFARFKQELALTDGNLGARTAAWGPKIRWRDGRQVLDELHLQELTQRFAA